MIKKIKIPMWNYNSITIIQQHLIIMRYSCRHCQRIDFVELTHAPMASPGLEGPLCLTRANDPIEKVYIPLRGGRTAWSPGTSGPQPPEMTGQSAVTLWQIVGFGSEKSFRCKDFKSVGKYWRSQSKKPYINSPTTCTGA